MVLLVMLAFTVGMSGVVVAKGSYDGKQRSR